MRKSFDEILNECIRELEASGADIEAVLSRYPEHADELRSHLEVRASLSAVEKAQATSLGAGRGRQQLLTAIARAEQTGQGVSLINNLVSKGGLSMRFLAMFVAGAAVAVGITFLTGNLELGGGGSSAEAEVPHECLEALDLNGDGELTVEDVMDFRGAIGSTDPEDLEQFDFNEDDVIDIYDVVFVVQELVTCFQEQQPPGPPEL
jgi:hypothetical protein